MNIRFVSTLTGDDESHFAPALLQAVAAVLDVMPIAYTIRIETLDARVFQHTHPSASTYVVEPDRKNKAEGLPGVADR